MDQIRDLRDKYFQVDDEYLNGYAKLCGINATGVYLSLCRHANKKQQCYPSKKLVAEELSICERSVFSGIKTLEEWGIIEIKGQGRKKGGSFRVNLYTLRDKKFWKPKPQASDAVGTGCLPLQAFDTSHREHVVPNKETHSKETHSKETHPSKTSVLQVNEVLPLFELINPSIDKYYGNKTQRKACERLLGKWSIEQIKIMVDVLPELNADKFAKGKSITPWELEKNLGYIKSYIEQKKNNKPTNLLKPEIGKYENYK